MTAAFSTGTSTFAGTLFTSQPAQLWSLIASGLSDARPPRAQILVRPADELNPAEEQSLLKSLSDLFRLRQLNDGWADKDSRALTEYACKTAVSILVALAIPAPPSPQLVPLLDGGVQIEWHVNGYDVEVEVDPTGEVHTFIAGPDESIVLDRELPPSLLHTIIPELKRQLVKMSRLLRDTPS